MDDVSAATWLADLIRYLRENDFGTLFDELALLPDQHGALRRRGALNAIWASTRN